MPLLEWKKSYEIGIDAVDHEHREMIDLINSLYEEMREGASEAEIIRFLGEIHTRISAHFALEENEMRSIGYHGYAAHKADHEDLLDEIRDIMDGYEDGEYTDMKDKLADQLGNWFGEHFKSKDSMLHRFLEAHT
ncbi:MAG: bacteriohemerythrin [Fimbriimonadaceae bacterium]|nr:bacteriohemerythrin [Alphaproteobacteria bacterium]